jgi:hypothetical protein
MVTCIGHALTVLLRHQLAYKRTSPILKAALEVIATPTPFLPPSAINAVRIVGVSLFRRATHPSEIAFRLKKLLTYVIF